MSFNNNIHQAKELIKYYLRAKSIYQIHSPSIFNICLNALDGKKIYYFQNNIESQRQAYLQSKESIPFIEFGAGAQKNSRKISEIAKTSLSSPWQCRIMFNLIDYYKPKTILEIGTSIGISTAYLASANKNAQVIGLEGNPSSAKLTRLLMNKLNISNTRVEIGKFEDTLIDACELLKKLDFVFVDGNHRKQATSDYFEQLLPYCHSKSILVFDDIHWSLEMTEAWNDITNDDRVKYSLDLYYFGIIFLDPDFLSKSNISYIDSKYKPWQKYLSE